MAQNYRLEDAKSLHQETVFPDANIFIYRYWPEVTSGKYAAVYKPAYNQLRKQGTKLVTTMSVLTEVENRVYKEQWNSWREKQIALGFHPTSKYKKFRKSPTGKAMLDKIHQKIRERILEHVELVDKKFSKDEAKALFTTALDMDLNDKVIAHICKEHHYIAFTHDGDFRYTDVDILTANGAILLHKR
jgi:predicted nucleic acid-binding protein